MKRSFGFTLIEAMISVALFGVLMAILFSAINSFQKGWLKEYSKQKISAQFVRLFRAVDSDLSKSDSKFFHFYNEPGADASLVNRRWFFFPITEEEGPDGLAGPAIDGTVKYNRLIVYYLKIPNKDNCIEEKFTSCPHKQLVRVKIAITGLPVYSDSVIENPNGNNNTFSYIEEFRNYMPVLTGTPRVNDSVGLKGSIKDIRVIESDIVDLTVNEVRNGRVRFDLLLLRIMDAQKRFTVGETKIITGSNVLKPEATDIAAKYSEETSWVTMTVNK